MFTLDRQSSTLVVRDAADRVIAVVFPDWHYDEACVLELNDEGARAEIAAILDEYFPTLPIVWPENVTVEDVDPSSVLCVIPAYDEWGHDTGDPIPCHTKAEVGAAAMEHPDCLLSDPSTGEMWRLRSNGGPLADRFYQMEWPS